MSKPRHPLPAVLAKHGQRVSLLIGAHGSRALALATLLASRGYPASTGGGGRGGGRTIKVTDENGNDDHIPVTGVEAAALNPDRWVAVDDRVAQLLHDRWMLDLQIEALFADLLAHASDDDPIPAGTGSCRRCEKFCRPDADHPDNRIRSGYCPPCYRRWIRAGKPERTSFERTNDEDAA